jgi:hypothetical protein
MQFFIYFSAIGLLLVSLFFAGTILHKGPARVTSDLFFADRSRLPKASRPDSTQSLATTPAAAPDMTAPAPDITAPAPAITAPTPDTTAPALDMTAAAPNVTAAAPDTTSDLARAAQPETQLVPKVAPSARAEATPKKKGVARKLPRGDYLRNYDGWQVY